MIDFLFGLFIGVVIGMLIVNHMVLTVSDEDFDKWVMGDKKENINGK